MQRVNIGIVGAGAISRSHMISLSRLPGVGLNVFDPDTPRARALADEFNAVRADSLDALAAGCDMVWVCSPPFAHRAALRAAIRAGRAVFCEKPLAADTADAAAIARAVTRSGTRFYMGHSGRWTEVFMLMHRLVQRGEIGEPMRVWSRRMGYLDPAQSPAWRLDDRLSGGAVVELGVHEIDFIRWIGGDWTRVFARGQDLLQPGYQDTMIAMGELAGGAVAHLELSWSCPRYLFQRGVEGRDGSLLVDDQRITQVELHRPGRKPRVFKTREDWQDPRTQENFSLRNQAKAVLRDYRGGAAYPVRIEDGLAAVRVAAAMRRSAHTGRTATLSTKGAS